MPFPFTHANGSVCCSNRKYLCDDCERKLAADGNLRAAADYTPPDPYKKGVEKLRRELPQAAPHKPMRHDDYTPPDPYADDLRKLREANNDN